MFKRILVIIIILCLGTAISLAVWKFSPYKTQEKAPSVEIYVVEEYRSLNFIPFYVAIEEGFFTQEGLQVVLQTAVTQENAIKAIFDGQAQVLLAGPEVGLYQYQQDNKKRLISIAKAGGINGSHLLARKKNPAFSWQDLKGKVIIGNREGELSQLLLKHILMSHELRPLQDVHLIYNLPRQVAGGVFVGGTGDYLLAVEPVISRLEKEHNFQVVAALGGEYPLPHSAAFMVREDFLKEHNTTCNKFITGFLKGLEWVDSHSPEEIVTTAQKYFPAEDEKVLLRAISRYKTLGCWPLSLLLEEESLNNLQDIMLAQKELKVKIPVGTLQDNSLAQKAVEQNTK